VRQPSVSPGCWRVPLPPASTASSTGGDPEKHCSTCTRKSSAEARKSFLTVKGKIPLKFPQKAFNQPRRALSPKGALIACKDLAKQSSKAIFSWMQLQIAIIVVVGLCSPFSHVLISCPKTNERAVCEAAPECGVLQVLQLSLELLHEEAAPLELVSAWRVQRQAQDEGRRRGKQLN
jgi:hypothetical protein